MKTSLAGCLNALTSEVRTLRRLDALNQRHFSVGSGPRATYRLTKSQLHLLTEGLFFTAFRAYEQFLRNVFLLYCSGIQPSKRRLVRSYLQPRNTSHAEELIQSSMRFLDWGSADTVVERAETYLKDGYPIKHVLSSHIEPLRDLRRLRNHIAHMSNESLVEYEKTVKRHFGVVPLKLPRPGEYLLLPARAGTANYYLLDYFGLIESVAKQMT